MSEVRTASSADIDTGMGRKPLRAFWYSVSSALVVVYLGAASANAYGTANALIGIVLSIVLMTLICQSLTGFSLRHGLNVDGLSRRMFGSGGAVIATITLFLAALYFAVFETSVLVFTFQTQFGGPKEMWAAIVVLYSTPLIIGRMRQFLDRINGWLLPIYWGGFATAIVWASIQYGLSTDWMNHTGIHLAVMEGVPGWVAAAASYMGTWSVLLFAVDFAALGRRGDVQYHRRWTFGFPFWVPTILFNSLIGIVLIFTIKGADVSEAGVAGGLVRMMGIIGLLLVFVSQTRINTANYYVAVTNLETTGRRALRLGWPTWAWASISAVLIFLMVLLPVMEYMLITLAWLGVVVLAWIGIALAHIFISDREADARESVAKPLPGWPGVVSWVVSAALGVAILQAKGSWISGYGAFVTLVVAALAYYFIAKAVRQSVLKKSTSEAL